MYKENVLTLSRFLNFENISPNSAAHGGKFVNLIVRPLSKL